MDVFGLVQTFSNCIIRPPRANYCLQDMGPKKFQYKSKRYYREDFEIMNNCYLKLQCSLYRERHMSKPKTTIIFLHANSSSRLSMKNYIKQLLPHYDLVGFDFSGSGLSQGLYTTLGYHQKEDLNCLINYLIRQKSVQSIILWGRSMGAVTAILYQQKYGYKKSNIKALVLDSPFKDLKSLLYELGDKYMPILPNFLFQSIVDKMQVYINENLNKQRTHYQKQNSYINFKHKCQFEIIKHSPISKISSIQIPIFFIVGKQDKLVDYQQVVDLYKAADRCLYKQLQILQGGHNDYRPQHVKLNIIDFLNSVLKKNKVSNINEQRQRANTDVYSIQNKVKPTPEEKKCDIQVDLLQKLKSYKPITSQKQIPSKRRKIFNKNVKNSQQSDNEQTFKSTKIQFKRNAYSYIEDTQLSESVFVSEQIKNRRKRIFQNRKNMKFQF